MWSYIQNELEYKVFWWENLREYCVQVLRNARWIGRANMDFEIFIYSQKSYAYDYIERYFINYLIREYGLIMGLIAILLFLVLVISLVIGAKRQLYKLDRCICMSCAVYFIFQMFFSIPANLGMQWFPPYTLSFLGVKAGVWYSDVIALSVYMAFYNAHKQKG